MKISFVLFLLLCTASPLFADESLAIDTGRATYVNNNLLLSDHVQLKHPIGTLLADEAELAPHPDERKIEKGVLKLIGHVNVNLRDGGQLTCGKAILDFHSNSGVFEGNETQPEVVYLENCKDKSKPASTIPMLLKSKKMVVEISRDNAEAKNIPSTYLSNIKAEEDVLIDYNHDFIAKANTATFNKEKLTQTQSKGILSGLVNLYAHGEEGVCQVTNRNGDLIKAKNICINTSTKEIDFAYPKGFLMAHQSDSKGDPIDFQAGSLNWNDNNQQLSLKDNVRLEQKGFFLLQNEDEIKITQASLKNKKQIETIRSEGKTVLTSYEKEKNKEHHLTCYGITTLDHARLRVYMESPRDDAGNVKEGQQVFFEDDLGQIYADKISFQYEMENNKSVAPKKLFLEGHVKMLNSYAAGPDPTSPLIRYALADKVEYDIPSKEAQFSSINTQKRVLFYDKSHDLEVSATSLKIKRDEVTKKETIKGMGDVRFSFIENEFEQLRNHFALDKLKDKKNDDSK